MPSDYKAPKFMTNAFKVALTILALVSIAVIAIKTMPRAPSYDSPAVARIIEANP